MGGEKSESCVLSLAVGELFSPTLQGGVGAQRGVQAVPLAGRGQEDPRQVCTTRDSSNFFFHNRGRRGGVLIPLQEEKGDAKKGDVRTLLTAGKQLAVSYEHHLPGPGHNPHQQPQGHILLFTTLYTLKFRDRLSEDTQSMETCTNLYQMQAVSSQQHIHVRLHSCFCTCVPNRSGQKLFQVCFLMLFLSRKADSLKLKSSPGKDE